MQLQSNSYNLTHLLSALHNCNLQNLQPTTYNLQNATTRTLPQLRLSCVLPALASQLASQLHLHD
jgi:anti-anti-sigma regulatory factor